MPRAVRLDALAGGAGGSWYVLMKGLARLVGEIHPDIHITVVEGGGISSWLLGTGVLTSNNAIGVLSDGIDRASLGSLPLSLIPTFAVPLWTISTSSRSCSSLERRTRSRCGKPRWRLRRSDERAQRPMPRAMSTAMSGMSASSPSSMWMKRRAPAISSPAGAAPLAAARFQRTNVRVGLIESAAMIT